MTRRLTSASVLHLMLVRGGCVGVREGEEERVYTGKGRRIEKRN